MTAQGLPPKYNGHCRHLSAPPAGKQPEVIRFKVPEVDVVFHDLIRGKVSFDAGLFGDVVIAKDLETPLYNFAVVVDDALMRISHMIRGEEHLSNTPKQILMLRALGFSEPIYAHLPLILNPDRSKMSKRFSDTAVAEYRKKGYLPEAIVNFLALLGWHPKDDKEILTRRELIELFDISRVQKAGAIFNQEKLDWLNREYLKKMSDAEIAELLAPMVQEQQVAIPKETLMKIVSVERGRASTLRDFMNDAGHFFFSLPEYGAELLIWQKAPSTMQQIASILEGLAASLEGIGEHDFRRERIADAVNAALEGRQKGEVFWPLRIAVSGERSSPDPIDIMDVLGKEESLRRIKIATGKAMKNFSLT